MNDDVLEYFSQQRDAGFTTIYLPDSVTLPKATTAVPPITPAKQTANEKPFLPKKPLPAAQPKTASAPPPTPPRPVMQDKSQAQNTAKPVAVLISPLLKINIGTPELSTSDKKAKLNELFLKLNECKGCTLSNGRHKTIFAKGNADAKLMVIGEFAEAGDELTGRPYSGESGELLTKIIENGLKLRSEDVFITTILKCPLPAARNPRTDEMQSCMKFIAEQIEIVRPKFLCILGRLTAAHIMGLPETVKERELNGIIHKIGPFKLVVIPTLSALLTSVDRKKEAWGYLKMLISEMNLANGVK
ncbi:MAG: uracil-DNA glycosylase [Fibrobacteres bacterium]|nr:uracil-DNA glycosylase [Fibrobacterota bacterium]